MIEPRGRWKRFLSVDEKINKLKEWQIIYPKAEKNIKIYYKGAYSEKTMECDVVGYVDDNEVIISINNMLHSIHPDYLAEMQKKERFIILDIETPMSFSPKDGIREVSAIALEDYREIDRIHLARIRNKEMYVRGYGQGLEPIERDEVLKGQFKAFIQTYKYPIITHNAAFDRNVLRYWKWIDKNHLFYCSMNTIKRIIKLESYTLEGLLKYYNISNDQKHNAVQDVLDLCELLKITRPQKWVALTNEVNYKTMDDDDLTGYVRKKFQKHDKVEKEKEKELLENAKNNKIEDIFKNKRVVFTGEMTKSRVEMRVVAIHYGAVTTTNVSAKTDILVVGYEPGVTKIKKAKEYGVKLISEDDFWSIINK